MLSAKHFGKGYVDNILYYFDRVIPCTIGNVTTSTSLTTVYLRLRLDISTESGLISSMGTSDESN